MINIGMTITDPDAAARLSGIKNKKAYITDLIKRDIMQDAISYEVIEQGALSNDVLASFGSIEEAKKYVLDVTSLRYTGRLIITTTTTADTRAGKLKGGKRVC